MSVAKQAGRVSIPGNQTGSETKSEQRIHVHKELRYLYH